MILKVLLKTALMLLIWLAFLWLTFYIGHLIIVTGTEWYTWPFIITTTAIMATPFILILVYLLNEIMNS
jgi:hypothetical protein